MKKYCISIDWLQVCCYTKKLSYIIENEYYCVDSSKEFRFIRQDVQTRSFSCFIKIFKKEGSDYFHCADLLACPRSSMLNQNIVLLKIANRYLYSQDYISLLYHLCTILHLAIKGLTRLDLCYDCNEFKNGRKPHKFIKDFVTQEFDSPRYIYKVGAKKFRVYGGKSVSSVTKFSGIEFGSGSSSKRCYIYDKTLELQEQHDKPWIRQYWERNGLISNEKTHVYRSEISIKCDGMDLLNMSTGQLFKLSPSYLTNQAAIEKLFHFYAASMFRFHVKGSHTRVRDYERIELFENSPIITCKPKKVCTNADTGRTEKICANTLSRLACRYSDLASGYATALNKCITFLTEVAGIKGAKEKLSQEINGLNAFKGLQFKEFHYLEYFALVEALGAIKYDFRIPLESCPDNDSFIETVSDDSLNLYYQYVTWCQDNEK